MQSTITQNKRIDDGQVETEDLQQGGIISINAIQKIYGNDLLINNNLTLNNEESSLIVNQINTYERGL